MHVEKEDEKVHNDKSKKGTTQTPLDALDLSFLEMTPMHLSWSSTTGSPDTNSKLWSISSSICSGFATRICVDITVASIAEGFIWSMDAVSTSEEKKQRDSRDETDLFADDLGLQVSPEVIVAKEREVLRPLPRYDALWVFAEGWAEVVTKGSGWGGEAETPRRNGSGRQSAGGRERTIGEAFEGEAADEGSMEMERAAASHGGSPSSSVPSEIQIDARKLLVVNAGGATPTPVPKRKSGFLNRRRMLGPSYPFGPTIWANQNVFMLIH